MKATLTLFSLALALFSSATPASDAVPAPMAERQAKQALQSELSVEEFKALIVSNPSVKIVDLRREEERKEFGYMAEAKAVDFLRSDFLAEFQKQFPDKASPVIVMCAVGGRASLAIDDLKELGYTNLSRVQGSFNAYKASGGKIVSGR